MKLLLEKKWMSTHTKATDCPHKVARAAPAMPHFSLKMNIGARMMFTPTEISADIIAFLG